MKLEPTFGGMSWTQGPAYTRDAHSGVKQATHDVEQAAKAELALHRHEGHSFIESDFGHVDGIVILNDTRGQRAAMSIEYGRGPSEDESDPFHNGTEGTWVLHKASGLPAKNVRPNSRRRKSYRPYAR